jgi:hypothetical protein
MYSRKNLFVGGVDKAAKLIIVLLLADMPKFFNWVLPKDYVTARVFPKGPPHLNYIS